ncbi:helix-turn-helix domain-containing protein [Streptomyces solisilvae]|uniref:helix-turn-helix domain-containing protein n=1 Tax=Streptomyces malaysiensis TaxID=92644 RepID=UPI00368B890C
MGELRSGDTAEAQALRALVRPFRDGLKARGLSQAQVAIRIGCDRSRVSRALSGSELPPLHLIEAVARAMGMDADETRRQWSHADALRRKSRACRAGGGPPDDLRTYMDMLCALRDLLVGRGLSQRELIRRDTTGTLRRATLGAVLRGKRSARREVVGAIVAACDVNDAAAAAWDTTWYRLGRPYQQEQHRRRYEGYKIKRYTEGMEQWV